MFNLQHRTLINFLYDYLLGDKYKYQIKIDTNSLKICIDFFNLSFQLHFEKLNKKTLRLQYSCAYISAGKNVEETMIKKYSQLCHYNFVKILVALNSIKIIETNFEFDLSFIIVADNIQLCLKGIKFVIPIDEQLFRLKRKFGNNVFIFEQIANAISNSDLSKKTYVDSKTLFFNKANKEIFFFKKMIDNGYIDIDKVVKLEIAFQIDEYYSERIFCKLYIKILLSTQDIVLQGPKFVQLSDLKIPTEDLNKLILTIRFGENNLLDLYPELKLKIRQYIIDLLDKKNFLITQTLKKRSIYNMLGINMYDDAYDSIKNDCYDSVRMLGILETSNNITQHGLDIIIFIVKEYLNKYF